MESNMYFPWLPVEIALSIFKTQCFAESNFNKDAIKKEIAVNSKL